MLLAPTHTDRHKSGTTQ